MMFLYTVFYYVMFFWVFIFMIIFDGVAQISENDVVDSLPQYDEYESYSGDDFQDITSYEKYYYSYLCIEDVVYNEYLEKVEQEDIPEIKAYIENFEMWVREEPDVEEGYDFDLSEIEEGDYFYIETDEFYDEYGCYDVYYFDMETEILYYFHNNI